MIATSLDVSGHQVRLFHVEIGDDEVGDLLGDEAIVALGILVEDAVKDLFGTIAVANIFSGVKECSSKKEK